MKEIRMSNTMTRADIAGILYNELGFSHAESLKIVDSIFQVMVDTISRAEPLKLSGFASFIPHQKVQRIGRNPRTGKEYIISPRTVLSFKASHLLKAALSDK